jgi:hypothetical protein
LYIENKKATGSVTITNDWQGSIEKINSITADVPSGLSGIELKIGSGCVIAGPSGTVTLADDGSDASPCKIMHNKGVIASGITVVTTDSTTATTASVDRVQGTIDYEYCYKIVIPTITIKTVPQ